jgi:tetratricopeptide (TPR) repeat protein
METAWRAVEGSAIAVAMLGHAYALAGRRAEAEKLLHELQGRVDRGQAFDPYALVTIYIGLGQKDQALEWLDKACGYRSSWLTCFAKGDPSLDPLRPDPGFQRILQRMGLAPER